MSSSSSLLSGNASLAVDVSGLQAADIIFTRNEDTQSKVIRAGSCSTYSHAILVLENGICIDATGAGVQKKSVNVALFNATYGALYRHKSIDANYAAWVCHYAEQQQGKRYDYGGALRAGVSTGCKSIRKTLGGVIIQLIDEGVKGGNHDNSFFCSELVVRAFEKGGLPLIRERAQMATPEAVARSQHLNYIKDIVTS